MTGMNKPKIRHIIWDELCEWCGVIAVVFCLIAVAGGIRACAFIQIDNDKRACEAVNGVWVEQTWQADVCRYLHNVSI